MTAKILAFPGVTPPRGDDYAERVPGLTGKQRALVIAEERSGQVSVRMKPAKSEHERRCVNFYSSVDAARTFADAMHRTYPELYVRVIDNTTPTDGAAA